MGVCCGWSVGCPLHRCYFLPGLLKAVSAPERALLNTDGAALPARSAHQTDKKKLIKRHFFCVKCVSSLITCARCINILAPKSFKVFFFFLQVKWSSTYFRASFVLFKCCRNVLKRKVHPWACHKLSPLFKKNLCLCAPYLCRLLHSTALYGVEILCNPEGGAHSFRVKHKHSTQRTGQCPLLLTGTVTTVGQSQCTSPSSNTPLSRVASKQSS